MTLINKNYWSPSIWMLAKIKKNDIICKFFFSQNDDLVFDQDGKQSLDEIPLIETRQQDSILHRLRRRFLDFFNPTTSTSTEAPGK